MARVVAYANHDEALQWLFHYLGSGSVRVQGLRVEVPVTDWTKAIRYADDLATLAKSIGIGEIYAYNDTEEYWPKYDREAA